MALNILLAFISAIFLTLIIGKPLIKYLSDLKMRQTERAEGVQSHLKKQGTPTMGGIMMIASFNIILIFFIYKNPIILPTLLLADGFALIGFIDDYLKVILKRSDGFKPKQKFIAQFFLTLFYALYLHYFMPELLYYIKIPFIKSDVFIGYFAIPLLIFSVLGTVNAVNFTDGIDGLASCVTIFVAGFFLLATWLLDKTIIVVPIVIIGVLLGFLFYNKYPAKIFMGDTGSLFLGAVVIGMAYMMNLVLFIPIIGFIYFCEILSVIIQVIYFKLTHGKRIFKMTPIHHHFELSGFSEVKIVVIFTLITAILAGISILFII